LGAPVDLFAALGFVAVFAGATNTPLASMIMGIELFGATHAVYLAVACFVAYLCSGHSSIYLAQRVGMPKSSSHDLPPDIAVRHVQDFTAKPFISLAGVRVRPVGATSTNERTLVMSRHQLVTKEIGMIRIYLQPREKTPGSGWFNAKPLYRELVLQAKAAGIMNAVAHNTHFGYSSHGKVQDEGLEIPNPELTMWVELIGARDQLEAFCRTHGTLLQRKVMVYKHLERWDVVGHDLAAEDALKPPA